MISAYLYQYIYIIVIAVLTLIVFLQYHSRNEEKELREAQSIPFLAFLLSIALSLFIGFRPVDKVFVDMVTYSENFYYLKGAFPYFEWNWEELNIIYDNLFAWSATIFDTERPIIVILAFLYFLGIFFVCRRMFPGNTLAALLTYLGAFSTFSYGTNGMKAGVAAVLFLLSLTFYNKKWIMFLLALLSFGIHHSMQLCIGTMILVLFYKKPKFYLGVWMACLIMAALHITFFQDFFSGMTDEHGVGYLSQVVEQIEKGWGGFRIDFILYSFAPIAFGIYAIFVKKINSSFYDYLFSLYLLTNSIWLLCIYANFTNRIAYLSWLMFPIVLIYPILHPSWGENRLQVFSFVMLGHLLFTLFMTFVYYG